MLVSLCYGLIRWLLEFVVLRVRSEEFKELEIVVLRHELAILWRTTRPTITAVDRVLLAAASRLLPRVRWRAFIVTPGEDIGLEEVGEGIGNIVYYSTLLGKINERTTRITGIRPVA